MAEFNAPIGREVPNEWLKVDQALQILFALTTADHCVAARMLSLDWAQTGVFCETLPEASVDGRCVPALACRLNQPVTWATYDFPRLVKGELLVFPNQNDVVRNGIAIQWHARLQKSSGAILA